VFTLYAGEQEFYIKRYALDTIIDLGAVFGTDSKTGNEVVSDVLEALPDEHIVAYEWLQ
jgi:hypothetical protein